VLTPLTPAPSENSPTTSTHLESAFGLAVTNVLLNPGSASKRKARHTLFVNITTNRFSKLPERLVGRERLDTSTATGLRVFCSNHLWNKTSTAVVINEVRKIGVDKIGLVADKKKKDLTPGG